MERTLLLFAALLTLLPGPPVAEDDPLLKKIFKDSPKAIVYATDHYRVYTNADTSVREEIGKHMEDLFQRFRKEFPFEEVRGAAPLHVYLFAEHGEFVEFVRREHPERKGMKDDTIPPFFYAKGGSSGYMCLWDMKKPRAGIFWHEGAHQLMIERLGITRNTPIWFEEGFANYVGTQVNKMEGDLWIWCADEYKKRVKALLAEKKISLAAILQADNASSRKIEGFRVLSWSVNDFLVNGGAREAFDKFILNLKKPKPSFSEVFAQSFGEIPALETRWKAFILEKY